MRIIRLAGPLIVLATLFAPLASANAAEKPWAWATQDLDEKDLAALHPIIRQLLEDDPVGTRRAWQSASGKSGFVYLDKGGQLAGSTEGTVRITKEAAGREMRLFVFRYRKDPEMGWAIVG